MLSTVIMGTLQAYAIPQPSEEHIEWLIEEGILEQQIEMAREIGSHRFSPQLQERLTSLIGNPFTAGFSSSRALPSQIPSAFVNTPTTGDVNVLVILIDFPNRPATAAQSRDNMYNLMFGPANPSSNVFPYESMAAFYYRSSYGQLRLSGEVWGHFRAPHSSTHYTNLGDMDELIEQSLNYFIAQGLDLSQFDNTGSGVVDSIFFKWTAAEGAWGSFWWAQQATYAGGMTFQGYTINEIVWQPHISTRASNVRGASLQIHEFGHLLGLPDFYDYNLNNPRFGIGRADMMDSNATDHNAFSKFLLGWIEPVVIGTGGGRITIGADSELPSAVLIMPDATLNADSSFYLVEFRQRTGNNARPIAPNPFTAGGDVVIWHVSAELNQRGSNFMHNNSNFNRGGLPPLLALVRRGSSQNINGINPTGIFSPRPWGSNSGHFFNSAHEFTPATNPNSNRWDSTPTGISITNISINSAQSQAAFDVNIAGNAREPRLLRRYYNYETGEIVFTFDSILTIENSNNVQIMQKGVGEIAGTFVADNNKLIFRPNAPLAPQSRLNVSLGAGVVSNSHNLGNVAYNFTLTTPKAYLHIDPRIRVFDTFVGGMITPTSTVFNINGRQAHYLTGRNARYEMRVENTTSTPITVRPVLAFFENGRFTHSEFRASVTIPANGSSNIEGAIANLPPNAEEDIVVKLMLWEDTISMLPLTSYFVLQ